MRRKVPPSDAASARASVVLPTPGMSSISTWPRAHIAVTARRTASGLPLMTWATLSWTRRIAAMCGRTSSLLLGGVAGTTAAGM